MLKNKNSKLGARFQLESNQTDLNAFEIVFGSERRVKLATVWSPPCCSPLQREWRLASVEDEIFREWRWGRTRVASKGGLKIKKRKINKSWLRRGEPNGKEVEKEGEKRSSGPSQDRSRGRRRSRRRGK